MSPGAYFLDYLYHANPSRHFTKTMIVFSPAQLLEHPASEQTEATLRAFSSACPTQRIVRPDLRVVVQPTGLIPTTLEDYIGVHPPATIAFFEVALLYLYPIHTNLS